MFKKGVPAYSIIKGKCPRCHEGDFFKYPFTLHPNKIIKIHKNCSHCNLKYMIEPSFFYGAMYINYALMVAVIIFSYLVGKIFINFSVANSFIMVVLASILTAPLNLRLSRILWIHLFISYSKENI